MYCSVTLDRVVLECIEDPRRIEQGTRSGVVVKLTLANLYNRSTSIACITSVDTTSAIVTIWLSICEYGNSAARYSVGESPVSRVVRHDGVVDSALGRG